MPKKIETPTLSEELIDYLDTLFPEKCADLSQTEKEIFYQSGQRSVVKHLIEKYKLQKET
jgi:hypothetical protein